MIDLTTGIVQQGMEQAKHQIKHNTAQSVPFSEPEAGNRRWPLALDGRRQETALVLILAKWTF
jgi:hypothetical protein